MSFVESRLDNCIRYELFTGFKSERNLYLYKKLDTVNSKGNP